MHKALGLILAIFICSLLLATSEAKKQKKEIYSTSRSYITLLSKQNFDKVVTKNRDKSVSIVHFYKRSDDGLDLLATDLDQTATEMKGVFRFGAVDCDEDTDICNKEKITKTPTVRVYPPNPVPALDHEGELSAKAIIQAAGKFVPSKVKEINGTTHGRFVDDNPSVPKIFLFTEKKGIPLIYRALSIAFDEKLFLSIVRSSESDLVKKYKVKTFPSILVVQTGEPKPIVYSGEIKYQPIFDFLNVYSQTFVPGGKDLNTNKPWLNEPVPELNLKSAGDTVLKTDGKLSVIYLDKQAPEDEVKNELSTLVADTRFENFKYSWLNVAVEPNWAKLFAKATDYPKVVVASFGKRKKYLVHEGEFNAASISKTLEKITNGDAHFTTIKGELPAFTH